MRTILNYLLDFVNYIKTYCIYADVIYYPLCNLRYIIAVIYFYFIYNLILLFLAALIVFFCFFFRIKRKRYSVFRFHLEPYYNTQADLCIEEGVCYRSFWQVEHEYLYHEARADQDYMLRVTPTGIFIYNILLLGFSFVLYFNYLFHNIFNFFVVWFCKKYKFVNFNIDWIVSFDYINFYFIILTNFIFFLLYFTIYNVKFKNDLNAHKTKLVLFLFLIIELSLVLTFSTSNIFFFFFFFECSLIPMYLLIQLLGKGLKKKQYAGLSLVFFTLMGSVFLLFGILYITSICGSSDFKHLNFELIDFNSQIFLFLVFFLGFSVKVPIFPFYSWLPEAHVEASTAISILLAAVFLKIATYGFLKILVSNFFLVVIFYYSIIFYFSVVSILIATFLVLIQTDLKKIIALSSIIHMNYMIIAIFTLDAKAMLGSFIYMLSHAFVSTALFFLIGILYENTGTRDLLNFSNFYKYNSKLYFFFFFFNLANISFPLLISFISELIILNNMMYYNILVVIFILLSIFFSAVYTFWMVHNTFFGKILTKKNFFLLKKFDVIFLIFLFFIVIILGIIPSIILYNLEQELYLILINKFNIY